ncbi:MAG: DUF4159 domain-containing protein [candidate division WOR-3 bacterium]
MKKKEFNYSISNLFFITIIIFYIFTVSTSIARGFFIARLKYSGGGDWYNDPDAIPNLAKELNRRTNIKTEPEQRIVSLMDEELFQCPFLFMTGHGNINFSEQEVLRLRTFLTQGGFLYVDDDYGMDEAFRREIKKVFPNHDLVELPPDHPIYHIVYDFPNGLIQIHLHYEDNRPRGYAIFYDNRLVVYYTYNSNISDGWTDAHEDPTEKREQAFQMGINIVAYALTH